MAPGALEHDRYLALLEAAGLVDASIEFTHPTGGGGHGAAIRTRRPG